MMRLRAILPALLLAGCGGSDGPDAAEKPAAAPVDAFAPGKWSARAALVSLDVPGEPRSRTRRMAAALAARMAPTTYCLTPADARQPPIALFDGGARGACRYERMAMAGGRIDGVMACGRPKTADAAGTETAMRMGIAGRYTPTAYRFDLRATYFVPGRPDVTSRMRVTGVRRGACRS